MKRISVALVHKHADTEGVKNSFRNSGKLQLQSVFDTAEQALADIPNSPPRVALIGFDLPSMSGIECTHKLKRIVPQISIVVLIEKADMISTMHAFQAGADGCLVRSDVLDSLEEVLINSSNGWRSFSKEIQNHWIEQLTHCSAPSKLNPLTAAEQKVMLYLIRGCSDKEIAFGTGSAMATVHSLTNRIFKKLNVHNRKDAVSRYLGFNRRQY